MLLANATVFRMQNCELHSNDATFQKKENVRLVHQIKKLTPETAPFVALTHKNIDRQYALTRAYSRIL